MKRIISPCLCETYKGKKKAFAKIEYENGRLSIRGVIGPRSNGDAYGSCGQCEDEIRNGEPANDWTEEMLQKFCDIWDRWHLNDSRPYCQHQKELGWDEIAKKKVALYHYKITDEANGMKMKAESKALDALRNGESFTPNAEQTFFASLAYFYDTYEELRGRMAEYYRPYDSSVISWKKAVEEKELGWLSPSEHPDGILSKECPVCGYRYGTSWKLEEVPEEVIEWLFSLPDAKETPAWV